MKIYRNKGFTKRDYECSNIVACVLESDDASVPDGDWESVREFPLDTLSSLWVERGVRYYGYL